MALSSPDSWIRHWVLKTQLLGFFSRALWQIRCESHRPESRGAGWINKTAKDFWKWNLWDSRRNKWKKTVMTIVSLNGDRYEFGDFKDTDPLDLYLQTLVNLIYQCLWGTVVVYFQGIKGLNVFNCTCLHNCVSEVQAYVRDVICVLEMQHTRVPSNPQDTDTVAKLFKRVLCLRREVRCR